MESDDEQSVIALKSFLYNLGFDKNDPQRTIDQNRSSANLAVSKINSHLFKFSEMHYSYANGKTISIHF